MLFNLPSQLSRNQEDGALVLHHEGHKFSGEELVEVHLVPRTQNAVREHLHHLERDTEQDRSLVFQEQNGITHATVGAPLYQRARANEVVQRRQQRVLADPGHEAQQKLEASSVGWWQQEAADLQSLGGHLRVLQQTCGGSR